MNVFQLIKYGHLPVSRFIDQFWYSIYLKIIRWKDKDNQSDLQQHVKYQGKVHVLELSSLFKRLFML